MPADSDQDNIASHASRPLRVMVVVGTRPEAIKVAPVAHALNASSSFELCLVSTGQHPEMLGQAFEALAIGPDVSLSVFAAGQDLGDLTAACLQQLQRTLERKQPDVCLVQGDTTSAMAGCLAAFYRRVPVVHLEAGLRTGNLLAPHPEEGNRRVITHLADLHLAPTAACASNLRQEGVDSENIVVTGNTVIDALHWMSKRVAPRPTRSERGGRLVLVTAHRRESWGDGLDRVAEAVRRSAGAHPDVEFLVPLHRSPMARGPFVAALSSSENITLTEPLSYREMVAALLASTLVLTDSGGLQEEAPSLGIPVLVLRSTTERPEAVDAGCVRLVGTDTEEIVTWLSRLLTDERAYEAMARSVSPYGDGRAASRVVDALLWKYRGGRQPCAFAPTACE